MGAALPDDDLAAVLTYIRQSWGNKASAITPEQVKAVRAAVGSRSQPWTAAELSAIQ
jgi:mono/diheme cytochrome c family protein